MPGSKDLLEVASQINLKKEVDSNGPDLRTTLIGWERDSYIITKIPTVNGKYLNWNSGVLCRCRFSKESGLYQFHTTLVKSIMHPMPLFFFTFPDKITDVATRGHERIQTYIPATLLNVTSIDGKESEIKEEGYLLNLSEGGALFRSRYTRNTNIFVDDSISLKFSLPDGTEIPKAVFKVRNIRISNGMRFVGVELLKKGKLSSNRLLLNFFEQYSSDEK
ncbi:MAG: flagellar brake protein [bacterium]